MSNKTIIKRFLISIFLLLIPFITSAQEDQVNIGGENFIVVVDVNIRDSHIINQDNNKIDLGFSLSNGK
jgi:competence protein ComGC